LTPGDVEAVLRRFTRYDLPQGIVQGLTETMEKFGKIRLVSVDKENSPSNLFLQISDKTIYTEIANIKPLKKYLIDTNEGFQFRLEHRGTVKWELIKLGWPVEDTATLVDGEGLEIELRDCAGACAAPRWTLRDYQQNAVEAVFGKKKNTPGLGFGVAALPCGSGKTIVGMAAMALLKTNTLILTTNVAAVHQWIDELLDKTTLDRTQIAEYTGSKKSRSARYHCYLSNTHMETRKRRQVPAFRPVSRPSMGTRYL
jgi:DNA excision repair protein ERCC-3